MARGWWWRAFSRAVSKKPLTLFFMHLATWVDRPLMRISGGRWRLSFVVPVLLMRCVGAKTGQVREVPLLYVPNGDAPLVIASNGGRTWHPAWCHNLRKHPEVTCMLEGSSRRYRAEELSGAAREQAWRQAVAVYPGYARYATRAERAIPLFCLRPLDR